MSVNPFCHAELVSTTVPNKIHLKESWIASLSLAMTILKIRNVIAKECICTTMTIHFCYLILFYFVVLPYIDYRIYSEQLWNSFRNDHALHEFSNRLDYLIFFNEEMKLLCSISPSTLVKNIWQSFSSASIFGKCEIS